MHNKAKDSIDVHNTLRRIFIKKIDLLISKNIEDRDRLDAIQMKAARALPLFIENEAYVDSLVLDYLSEPAKSTKFNFP